MKINEIKNYLPHRYPFLLVDRVTECNPGKSVSTFKNITANEEFFSGHFPQKPVMPGVLMIEALAQTAGLLIFYTTNQGVDADTNWFYLAGVDKARFKRIVEPGDRLTMMVSVIKQKRDLWVFDAKALVESELACSAELLLIKGVLK